MVRVFRPLVPADAPWLSALHALEFDPPWSAQGFADLLVQPTILGWTIEVADGQKLPAFILVQINLEEAEILAFQVHKDLQGQGHGAALLDQALSDLSARAITLTFLEVAPSRITAAKLYDSRDFCVWGRRKNYYKTANGREDALLLRRLMPQNIK